MPTASEDVWHSIAESELAAPGVTAGTGFGRSEGLRVSGKIFAMQVRGELVVKLLKDLQELTASGLGHSSTLGTGGS